MKTRTITLTNRPPVRINEENWPVIAEALDDWYEGEHEFQANTKKNWWIKVRQHEDGRAIVYAGYTYTTAWRGAREYVAKRGVLLPAGTESQQICDTIHEVCLDIASAESYEDDCARWPTLAAACIADMPADELD